MGCGAEPSSVAFGGLDVFSRATPYDPASPPTKVRIAAHKIVMGQRRMHQIPDKLIFFSPKNLAEF